MIYKTHLPIAVLAILVFLAPAAASAASIPFYPFIPVPAGEIQHTVTETKFQSSVVLPGTTPWDRIEETWVSARASRSVQTDATSGQLIRECTGTPASYSCYDAQEDGGTLVAGTKGPELAAGQSWETEGKRIELEVARGWLRLTGNTTFLGRPAKTYAGTGEHTQFTIIADTATGYPLETTVALWGGAQTDAQVSTVIAFEILSPKVAAQDLAPKAHPGAKESRAQRRPGARPNTLRKHRKHKHRGLPDKQTAARR